MSRWFSLNSKYYRLDSFTHFEATRLYKSKGDYRIKGHLNLHEAEGDQVYAFIGGHDHRYESHRQAIDTIEAIITGEYDVGPEIYSEAKQMAAEVANDLWREHANF